MTYFDNTPTQEITAMSEPLQLAETVRQACLRAALDAYENAGISGLCGNRRWEPAVQAIRHLDLQRPLDTLQPSEG